LATVLAVPPACAINGHEAVAAAWFILPLQQVSRVDMDVPRLTDLEGAVLGPGRFDLSVARISRAITAQATVQPPPYDRAQIVQRNRGKHLAQHHRPVSASISVKTVRGMAVVLDM